MIMPFIYGESYHRLFTLERKEYSDFNMEKKKKDLF